MQMITKQAIVAAGKQPLYHGSIAIKYYFYYDVIKNLLEQKRLNDA
jgi:hypothetical protein